MYYYSFFFGSYSRGVRALFSKMPLLPAVETPASSSGTTATEPSRNSAVSAIPSQVPELPTCKTRAAASTTSSASTTTSTTITVPRQVPVRPARVTRSAASSTSTTSTAAIVSVRTVPSHVPNLAASVTTAAAAAGGGGISSVTIPSDVPRIAAIVTPGPAVAPISTASPATTSAAACGPAVTVTFLLGGLEGRSVGSGDVDGLSLLVDAELDLELDEVALGQATEAIGFDRGLVDEQIFATVVGRDEPEALHIVEPPDHTSRPLLRHWIEP